VIPAVIGAAVWWEAQRSRPPRRGQHGAEPSDRCVLSVLDTSGAPVVEARVLMPGLEARGMPPLTDARGRVHVQVDPEQRTEFVVAHPAHAMKRVRARAGSQTVRLAPLHNVPFVVAIPALGDGVPEGGKVVVVPVPRHGDDLARRLASLEQDVTPGVVMNLAVPRLGPYALWLWLVGPSGRRARIADHGSVIVDVDGSGARITAAIPLDAWASAMAAVGAN